MAWQAVLPQGEHEIFHMWKDGKWLVASCGLPLLALALWNSIMLELLLGLSFVYRFINPMIVFV